MVMQPDISTKPDAKTAWGPPLDEGAAALFLRAQAASLASGLGGNRSTVRNTLAAHSQSHERWLRLVAEVRDSLGDDAAQHVAALYMLHGRVAESLARRSGELLDDTTAEAVQRLLAEWLDRLTDATLATLRRQAVPG
ncbi:MAG: hypothetical protein M3415_04675 [Actinomycetota bacterium]|nr:hypothetical protein [Actinomycetota bacterium]